MIPAPAGLVAFFKHDDPQHHSTKPVVAFNDDGDPLIAEDQRRLVPAASYRNCSGGWDPTRTRLSWRSHHPAAGAPCSCSRT